MKNDAFIDGFGMGLNSAVIAIFFNEFTWLVFPFCQNYFIGVGRIVQ